MYEDETYRQGAGSAEDAADTAEKAVSEGSNPYFDYTGRSAEELNSASEAVKPKKKEKQKRERRPMGGFGKFAMAIGLGLCFGACAGLGFFAVNKVTGRYLPDKTQASPAPVIQQQGSPAGNNGPVSTYVTYTQNDIVSMVDEVMPAMVSIVNNYTATGYWGFFGQKYNEDKVASGSGIIVGQTDDLLLIATNNHVVEDANKLEVTFADGTTAEALIKGTDPDMDLAVIAVSLKNLDADTMNTISIAKLGDSDELKLGEPVVAIGNALGYGQSVTNGIVSALNRELTNEDGSTNTFIQTNAAINPGNSGGALLNINGEVIGINSSKIGGSTIEGMGYAIPISSASPILTELMERENRIEKVDEKEMGYMGVSLQTVTDEIANTLDMPKGVCIMSVGEDSAAEKAGLCKGDIVVKLNGQKVSTSDELRNQISYYRAGETITLSIKRPEKGEYQDMELELTLGKRPVE